MGAKIEETNGEITVKPIENPVSDAILDVGESGFGLRNVDMRIRLYYHQSEGLEITSGPGGTRVSFCVPLRSREEIADDEGISG